MDDVNMTPEQKNWLKSIKLSEIHQKALVEHNKIQGFKNQSLVLTCAIIGNMRGYCNIPQIVIILLQEKLLSEVGPALQRTEELADEAAKWINM